MLCSGAVSIQYAFILPTTRCDAHCEHCFYETGHSERTPSVDFLEPLDAALDGMVRDGLQQVIISGGEPLMAPGLQQLVELCADKLVHILLITRGELLDEQTLESLERWGVDDITISASEPSEGLRATVNRVIFRSRYMPTVLTCLTRKNVGQIDGMLELSSRFELPLLFTPAYIPKDWPAHGELSLTELSDEQWDEAMEALGPWAEQARCAPYLSMVRRFYGGQKVHPSFCAMGSAGLVVDADATVYPCFHRHDLPAGNLLTDSWDQIHKELGAMGPELMSAPCFGEHCLSMFVGIQV